MIKQTLVFGAIFSTVFFSTAAASPKFDKSKALDALMEGNKRFTENKSTCFYDENSRRLALTQTQEPFAVIVGCSDSRVPPEIIFNYTLGDLFVVRVAGNVIDHFGLGSIEYAVEYLKTPLIFVLGHENCGAVDATLQGKAFNDNIENIVDEIRPAVEDARKKEGNLLKNAIQENVRHVMAYIQTHSPTISRRIKEGTVQIVGGYYELGTGKVILLEDK